MTPAFAPLGLSPRRTGSGFWSRTIPSSCAASSRDGCRKAASRWSATVPNGRLAIEALDRVDARHRAPRPRHARARRHQRAAAAAREAARPFRDRGLDADPAQCRDLAEMPVPRRARLPAEAGDEPRGHDLARLPPGARREGRRARPPAPRRVLIGDRTASPRRRGAAPARTGRAALPPDRRLDGRSACDRRGPRRPQRRAAAGADARRAAHAADLHDGLRRALQGQLGVPAREARDGEAPVAGQIYVAPGGRHMGLSATSSTRSCSASTTGRR